MGSIRIGSISRCWAIKERFELRNGAKLVGTVANVRQTKGYEFFIQAARKVVEARADVFFWRSATRSVARKTPVLFLEKWALKIASFSLDFATMCRKSSGT